MDNLAILGQFMAILEEKHYAAVVLALLLLITRTRLGPPKG